VKSFCHFALVTAVFCACTAFSAETKTMRLDYYHTGNDSTELFSVEQLVLEPLPWPGNPSRPIDETLRGKYAFEIISSETGSVLYSRSFSSVYGEWETTGEAHNMNRTFHESLRFPAPGNLFKVVIKKRDAKNDFQEIWSIQLDPEDYLVHHESAAYASQVEAIQYSGDSASKVDILLLGDGYTLDERDSFLQKARELTEVLFASAPFNKRQSDFNVWALAPASKLSGVSRPSTGTYRDSPLGASYDAFRSERYVLTYENKAMRRIASSASYDFIEILTNTDTYGGGGIYGLYSTAAANNEWADYLFVHEFAHHFAGLADEYYTSSVAYEPPDEISEPYEPNVTALLDPEKLKWKHLVDETTPLPTEWPKEEFDEHAIAYTARRNQLRAENAPESDMNALFRSDRQFTEGLFSAARYQDAIGAFQGANYLSSGFYRSEMNCIMFTRTTDFCAVCGNAIELVIDEYSLH
jgi:hypothetical protein